MITSAVTKRQIETWKRIYAENRHRLSPNRIGGEELDAYFRAKYHPQPFDSPKFRNVVILNALAWETGYGERDLCVRTYLFEDVVVGIDLTSGFFHVESETTERMSSLYDDLFVQRGLNEKDLENYVITGQYLELTGMGSEPSTSP